ncbi:hypothetical protein [Spirillospora sp. CA-294931]|uniref:hypothetical protein n=1 Tax=Spirillospora sp. CA-294931 TaxID=3240042 RepID=UPI003D8F324E
MAEPRGDRAAFRAWVRAHHPDAGGDPEEFAAGLERMRAPRPGAAPVVVVRRRRGPIAVYCRWRERRRRARLLL